MFLLHCPTGHVSMNALSYRVSHSNLVRESLSSLICANGPYGEPLQPDQQELLLKAKELMTAKQERMPDFLQARSASDGFSATHHWRSELVGLQLNCE